MRFDGFWENEVIDLSHPQCIVNLCVGRREGEVHVNE